MDKNNFFSPQFIKFHFLITFLCTVLMDVDYGLFIGVGYHVIIHIVRSTQYLL